MRDFIVLLIFIGSIPAALLNPVHGIFLYTMVSYLNPHRMAWGYSMTLPMAKAVAIATIVSFIFYRGDKKLPRDAESYLFVVFWMLAAFGWVFALNPTGYMEEFQRLSKILLMIVITVCLIKSKKDLRWLVLIIAISIGFHIVKGAIWGLRGGVGWVKGPSGTFFGGNNEMGLVANMVWPFFFFIANTEKNKWFQRGLWCIFWITPLTIILTKSRGAALAMVVTGAVLFTRVKRKLIFIIIGVLALIAIIPFVPNEWYSRMETIKTYEQDGSAMGRINAWYAAWNLAIDRPLTGGGLRALILPETIYRYAPNPEHYADVHSIYFEILGELGFPGLIVFLCIITLALFRLNRIKKLSKNLSDGEFYLNYSNGIFLGLVAYIVNGVFLGLAYFDLFYQYVGLTITLSLLFDREMANNEI